MAQQSVLSLQYVRYSITALVNGVPYNPTADVVQFAFTQTGVDPVSGDWKTGSWETVVGPPQLYVARCLVGPAGTIALAKGTYNVYVKVTDSPEVPVLFVDTLKIS